ncbi:MAG: DUF262 domain-containing protein [Bifidobacteriaceae bacterium]|nr:DUF262 domain-containing protein [Bifidobacteriaceae bacterium]
MNNTATRSSAQYRIDQFNTSQLDRIELPKFQRGFVWNKAKQNDFVQTLHDGYPFGTLLVYPVDNTPDSKMKLLDGQQRLSTIKKYIKNPLTFWKPLNSDVYRQAFDKASTIVAKSGNELSEKEFDEHLIQGIFHESMPLFSWALSVTNTKDEAEELLAIINELAGKVNNYVDLSTLQIPMIVYQGPHSTIADVFANLNKGGVPLSKYEVFGAAWVDEDLKLSNTDLQDEIIQLVKQYYLDMQNDAEFDISNFSEDDLTQARTISLAEFGRALGQFIAKRMPSLVSEASNSTQEIGFGLLGVITKVSNRKLGMLNMHTQEIQSEIESILQKADRISKNINDIFGKLLLRFKATGNKYEMGLNATFKTLSYFAALWDLDPSSQEYRDMLHNIKAYYVYDFVTSAWTSHGDQRLDEFTQGHRSYAAPVAKDAFTQAFVRWINEETPGINFTKDVKALTTIHANLSYLSAATPDGESFELEHIVPRKLLNDVEDPKHRTIIGGLLGNCMYLPKSLNNKKKTKTLYDVNDYGRYSQLIEQSDYLTQEEFKTVFAALKDHDPDRANRVLRERAKKVAAKIIEGLCD